jgi:ATP-dependent Clp protease adaptor protein ClpS
MGSRSKSAAAAVEQESTEGKRRAEASRPTPKRYPQFNVVLLDDDDHTYDYVIRMMADLFGHPAERGKLLAEEVDTTGRCICLTTAKEHAELKRDQIHAFGRDKLMARSKGSMRAVIEPVPGSE